MTLRTASAQVKLRDLTATFDQAARAQSPFYPRVCTMRPSNGHDENYGWLGSMPTVKEWLGDRVFEELRAASYLLKNKDWESSLKILQNDIEDDRLGQYVTPMSGLGRQAMLHPDNLLFNNALIVGESEACFDGQFFFDTDHSWGDSGSQSNDLSSTVVSTTAVTLAEFDAAYHAAREALINYKNDRGEFFIQPVVQGLTNLMLVVPTELELVAKKMVNSQLTGGGNSNVVLDKPEIVVSPFLTNATKFYLFNLDSPLKPFVFQARQSLRRQMKGADDIEFKDVKFMTSARYNIGFLAWWNAVLTTFTT